ncbi:MAG TPA: hypothetical protein VH951_07440 [Dehalococcoidia bacterium]
MTKQEILEAITKLPDDATYEDAIERLEFMRVIAERLKRLDAGEPTIPHEEAKIRLAKWRK